MSEADKAGARWLATQAADVPDDERAARLKAIRDGVLARHGVRIVGDALDTPSALLAEIRQSIDRTTATMYAATMPYRYQAMLRVKCDEARRVAIDLAAGDAELPALPPRVDDGLADLQVLAAWCIEATRDTTGVDNSQLDMQPAEYFGKRWGITADRLRKARKRGALKRSNMPGNGGRWYYSVAEVENLWPDDVQD